MSDKRRALFAGGIWMMASGLVIGGGHYPIGLLYLVVSLLYFAGFIWG